MSSKKKMSLTIDSKLHHVFTSKAKKSREALAKLGIDKKSLRGITIGGFLKSHANYADKLLELGCSPTCVTRIRNKIQKAQASSTTEVVSPEEEVPTHVTRDNESFDAPQADLPAAAEKSKPKSVRFQETLKAKPVGQDAMLAESVGLGDIYAKGDIGNTQTPESLAGNQPMPDDVGPPAAKRRGAFSTMSKGREKQVFAEKDTNSNDHKTVIRQQQASLLREAGPSVPLPTTLTGSSGDVSMSPETLAGATEDAIASTRAGTGAPSSEVVLFKQAMDGLKAGESAANVRKNLVLLSNPDPLVQGERQDDDQKALEPPENTQTAVVQRKTKKWFQRGFAMGVKRFSADAWRKLMPKKVQEFVAKHGKKVDTLAKDYATVLNIGDAALSVGVALASIMLEISEKDGKINRGSKQFIEMAEKWKLSIDQQQKMIQVYEQSELKQALGVEEPPLAQQVFDESPIIEEVPDDEPTETGGSFDQAAAPGVDQSQLTMDPDNAQARSNVAAGIPGGSYTGDMPLSELSQDVVNALSREDRELLKSRILQEQGTVRGSQTRRRFGLLGAKRKNAEQQLLVENKEREEEKGSPVVRGDLDQLTLRGVNIDRRESVSPPPYALTGSDTATRMAAAKLFADYWQEAGATIEGFKTKFPRFARYFEDDKFRAWQEKQQAASPATLAQLAPGYLMMRYGNDINEISAREFGAGAVENLVQAATDLATAAPTPEQRARFSRVAGQLQSGVLSGIDFFRNVLSPDQIKGSNLALETSSPSPVKRLDMGTAPVVQSQVEAFRTIGAATEPAAEGDAGADLGDHKAPHRQKQEDAETEPHAGEENLLHGPLRPFLPISGAEEIKLDPGETLRKKASLAVWKANRSQNPNGSTRTNRLLWQNQKEWNFRHRDPQFQTPPIEGPGYGINAGYQATMSFDTRKSWKRPSTVRKLAEINLTQKYNVKPIFTQKLLKDHLHERALHPFRRLEKKDITFWLNPAGQGAHHPLEDIQTANPLYTRPHSIWAPLDYHYQPEMLPADVLIPKMSRVHMGKPKIKQLGAINPRSTVTPHPVDWQRPATNPYLKYPQELDYDMAKMKMHSQPSHTTKAGEKRKRALFGPPRPFKRGRF